ncbi:MAG: PAS domain S-box protein [Lentisphaerae bacterium]|nr:PAS domain S-box protein [Lentisphaerota bacterium]
MKSKHEQGKKAAGKSHRAEGSLKEQLDFSESLIETAQVLILVLDTRGRIVRFNPYMEKLVGYDLNEVKGMDWFETFLSPEISRTIKPFFQQAIDNIQTRGNVNPILAKDGRTILVEWNDKTLKDKDGRTVGLLAIGQDITDRKRAETYREMEHEILRILNEPGDLQESIQHALVALKTRAEADAVGLRLQEGEDFPYFVQDGFSKDFLLTENTLAERGKDGGLCRDKDGHVSLDCLCGLVISGKTDPSRPIFSPGGSYWTNDSLVWLDLPSDQDPGMHLRNTCIQQGYASVALIPVRNRDLIVGLLQLNFKRKGRLTREAIEILEGIAAHIGSALMRKRAEDALRKSEETHRALVAGLPDTVMRFNRQGAHLFVPENVRTTVDLNAVRCIAKTHAELGFSKTQCRFLEESIRGVFDSGAPFETEFTVEGKTGTAIFNWRLVPERDALGAVYSVLAISRDITAHRKAEREYTTLFREMLDGFALHEIVCDAEGNPVDYRFLSVNPAFERMTGLKAEAIVGRTVREVLPCAEEHWIETYGKVALTGESIFFENYSADLGKHFEVTAFRPATGQFVCIFQDITDRKRAEDALRSSRQLLEATEALSAVGGWEWDVTAQVMVWTDGTYRIHELDSVSMPAGSPAHIERSLACYDPEDRLRVEDAFRRCIEAGEPYDLECAFTTTAGRRLCVRTMGRAIRKNGRVVKVQGNLQDITERKKAEAQQKNLQAECFQAQKMESVGRLAGGVAHDFNNLLTGIMGYTELCQEHVGVDHPIADWLDEIAKGAQRSANLTRQLLAFARKQTILPQFLDLNDAVSGMLKLLRRLIGEDIALVWMPGTDVWPIKVDPGQIDQILANLSVNARDAIGGVGRLTIETHNTVVDRASCSEYPEAAPGDYVVLMVSDDGCGMDRETLTHIFEPFFTTKEAGLGTGLGLATVYGIVKQNGGFITVDSAPGNGTTFRVHLPRCEKTVETSAVPQVPEARPGGFETILLVEDETSVRVTTALCLEAQGYAVLTAADPGEALRLAERHSSPIHLLITDVVMPCMNGRALAAKLTEKYPRMKCLFISGYTANVIAHRGILEEGVHFLAKPFTRDVMARKVYEVLKGGQTKGRE